MAARDSGRFYYFAYGTFVDVAELKRSIVAVSSATVPVVHSAHPALLPGYRLVCDAVSVEGPRLACVNVAPYSLVPRDPAAARRSAKGQVGPPQQEYLAAFRDGVRGVLYELSANTLEPLLQAVAREGSYTMCAMLTCYEMSDVQRGVRAPDSPIHEALVVAAIDMPLLECKYLIEAPMRLRWQPLPKPLGVPTPPGLASGVATASTGDAAAERRWPALHWCNCVNSTRVAPSTTYAAALEKAYREHLHVKISSNESAASAGATASPATSQGGDCESYAGTLHRMVYARARDVAADAQEAKTWYLAYGSNLSWEQVCVRIGPPYQRRAVKLADYVLVANTVSGSRPNPDGFGYYNVEPRSAREKKQALGLVQHRSTMPRYVCGAAYEISQAQLELMDQYERGYHRELLRCTDLRDTTAAPLECWTYIAEHTSEEVLPSREYLARVLEGADILPLEYMEGIRATPTNAQRSPRQDRRLRKEV